LIILKDGIGPHGSNPLAWKVGRLGRNHGRKRKSRTCRFKGARDIGTSCVRIAAIIGAGIGVIALSNTRQATSGSITRITTTEIPIIARSPKDRERVFAVSVLIAKI